jgi:serine/threonine protein kinase
MVKRIPKTGDFRPLTWRGPLTERYKDFTYLTKGGQGDLYSARDQLNDGARVAIKFLAQNPTEIYEALFDGEVKMHTALVEAGVPNIAMVAENIRLEGEIPRWDYSEIRLKDGITFNPKRTPYFAIQCFEGIELAELIDGIKSSHVDFDNYMDPCDIGFVLAGLMLNLLDALEGVHKQGYIHRDVQPRNVFVGFDGIARLLDFGMAPFGKEEPKRGGIRNFMAPERQKGEGVYPQSDIFALGCLGYLVLTGSNPNELFPPIPVNTPERKVVKGVIPQELFEVVLRDPGLTSMDDVREMVHRENRPLASILDNWVDPNWERRDSTTQAKQRLLKLYPDLRKWDTIEEFTDLLRDEFKNLKGLKRNVGLSVDSSASLSSHSLIE